MTMLVQPALCDLEGWLRLARLEDLGFELLDASVSPALSGGLNEGQCRMLRESGRLCSVHGAFIDVNPASGDPEIAALSRRRCEQSCELAVRLGARYVIFHGSCFPFLRGEYLKNWAKSCAAFYDGLAEKYPLTICVENSFDLDAAPLCRLMDSVRNEGVRVCLDIGHCAFSRIGVRQWFEALAERIGYLHLSDNDGAFDEHLPLGSGNAELREAGECLRRLNRAVPVTLEVGAMENVRSSLAWLRGNGLYNHYAP